MSNKQIFIGNIIFYLFTIENIFLWYLTYAQIINLKIVFWNLTCKWLKFPSLSNKNQTFLYKKMNKF